MNDAPEIGEIFDKVEIIAVGNRQRGDGVYRTPKNFVVFVHGTAKGDIVTIEVHKVFEKYAFAHVLMRWE